MHVEETFNKKKDFEETKLSINKVQTSFNKLQVETHQVIRKPDYIWKH